jgi:uracil permease
MFPATVLVAAICGFHVGTVLTISGVGTIIALVLAKWRIGKFIPLFYGSSFSYIAAYLAIVQQMTGSLPEFGVPVSDEVLSTMQAGILVTGLFNILIGALIRALGKEKIDMVLPPIVTGSVAAIIGFGLAAAALNMAAANWTVSLITLFATIMFSVYLQNKGFFGMIPVLLGAVVGYVLSALIAPGSVSFASVAAAPWFAVPHFTFPSFSGALVGTAIFSIAIMAIATIPESTAHLYWPQPDPGRA